MSSNEPVRNECEVHFKYHFIYITSQKSDQFLTITFSNEANNKNKFVLCFTL